MLLTVTIVRSSAQHYIVAWLYISTLINSLVDSIGKQ